MAPTTTLTPDQIKILLAKGFSDNELISYLQQIRSHQQVNLEFGKETLLTDPHEAWELILSWLKETHSNYSTLERGSQKVKINHLIDNIESHQQITRTAAAAGIAMREKSINPEMEPAPPLTLNSHQKALAKQRNFFNAYNAHLLNPLSNKLMDSPLLAHIKDPHHRKLIARQLAANWPNYLQATDPALSSLPPAQAQEITNLRNISEITHLLNHSHSAKNGPLAQLIHSDDGEGLVADITTTITHDVQDHYTSKDKYNRQQALQDASQYAQFALLGSTLTAITQELNSSPTITLDPKELSQLTRALRQNIISASQNPQSHLSANDIISNTLNQLNVPTNTQSLLALELRKLSPQIESTQISLRADFLDNTRSESSNQRLLSTARLSQEVGVNPLTPWLKKGNIARAKTQLLGNLTFQEAIQQEIDLGNSANPLRLNQIMDLWDKETNYNLYQTHKSSSTWFSIKNGFAHASGNARSVRQSYRHFTTKAWGKYSKIDSIIHYPQNKLVDTWQDAVAGKFKFRGKIHNIPTILRVGKTNIPLLNLPGFAVDQFIRFKKNIALGIFKFTKSGTRPNSFIWRGVANYSKAFFKSDGNFSQTNFFMFDKARGNLLNWASKKATNKSWSALKATFGAKLWSGFSKVAPGLAQKFAGTAIQKAITSLSLAGLSGGTTILIQAGFAVVGMAFKNAWKFITNGGGFRDRTINLAPIMAGIVAIPALLTSGLGAIALGISGTISAFGIALTSVPAFIIAALGISLGAVFILLFFFGTMIKPQWDIDTPIHDQLDYSSPANMIAGTFSDCGELGNNITTDLASKLNNGTVNLLPDDNFARDPETRQCIKPTIVIIHWSGGGDGDDGNNATYNTLVARKIEVYPGEFRTNVLACHLAADNDDVMFMQQFYEEGVEMGQCAGSGGNPSSVQIEMSGQDFKPGLNPPTPIIFQRSVEAICHVMKQYKMDPSQIFGHYHFSSAKTDPGKEFLEQTFIPATQAALKDGCKFGNIKK